MDKDKKNIRVTKNDLDEFNMWIKSKSKDTPRLREKFKDDNEYEDFMMEYQDKNKTFSGIAMPDEDTAEYTFGSLVGTLNESIGYAHLYHFVIDTGYAHNSLQTYYEDMPDKMDALAEKMLANGEILLFRNEIFPKGCPIDYFTRLKTYIISSSKQLFINPDTQSAYQSLIDDIVNTIDTLLYRLKRLSNLSLDKQFSVKLYSAPFNGYELSWKDKNGKGCCKKFRIKKGQGEDEIFPLVSKEMSNLKDCSDITIKKVTPSNEEGKLFSLMDSIKKIAKKPLEQIKDIAVEDAAGIAYDVFDKDQLKKAFPGFEGESEADLKKYLKDAKLSGVEVLGLIFALGIGGTVQGAKKTIDAIKKDIQKHFSEGKCPEDGCVQKDGDKWMIISNKTGKPWKPRYETEEKANNALAAYHANKFSETSTKFMQRIMSAQIEGEDDILNMIKDDLGVVMEDGKLETEQLSYNQLENGSIQVLDTVNNQATLIEPTDDSLVMSVPMDDIAEELDGDPMNPNDVVNANDGVENPEKAGLQTDGELRDIMDNDLPTESELETKQLSDTDSKFVNKFQSLGTITNPQMMKKVIESLKKEVNTISDKTQKLLYSKALDALSSMKNITPEVIKTVTDIINTGEKKMSKFSNFSEKGKAVIAQSLFSKIK